MAKHYTHILLFCFLSLFSANNLFAFELQKLIEITNKRGELQICNGDLSDIFTSYDHSTSVPEIYFEDLRISKVDKLFYLFAKEQNSTNAYAFPLCRYKGALLLDTSAEVCVTAKGEAALRAAILSGDHSNPDLQTLTATHFPKENL
ncbi:hypothetical protein FVR03_22600 [Pontibacter qinzhouensis]|uniref:Uncharacterized protein n=1 Tax=Pontibacter qinzhouensis TaxID=2603253 RepID=A0A5C8IQT9_9BACT|nr:hypothetical protein [Pontibacter qinzhouensis]TXK23469.1 hypothetical protein FVR03_22600 [Pontibacter qinzhouensis]